MMTDFYVGTGRRLSDADFAEIANKHGIEEAALRAIKQVEAGRSGFQSGSRVKALYEPHIAWRQTRGAKRNKLAKAGLAYARWKRNYPKTSFGRIDKCSALVGDEIAALSTSWGLGQIMGFNHKACGFPTALAMVRHFAKGEAEQLEGMVQFIKSNSAMFNALKKGDWAGFARRYNGPGYKKNKYDSRLRNAYRKWSKKPKTRPAPVKKAGPDPHVMDIQRMLNRHGHTLRVDGDNGPATKAAIRLFQEKHGLVNDGIVGPRTMAALREKPEAEKQKAELQEIVEDAAATDRISSTNVAAGIAGVSGVGGVATQASEAMNKVQDLSYTASSIQDTIVSVGPWVILAIIIAGACFYIWKERRRKAREAKEALQ